MSLEIKSKQTILAIETSCDETSAAILRDGELASVVISSQLFHNDFGGVVPELASRAHMRAILPIVKETLSKATLSLDDLTAIAVTNAPGLMGSLLVGTNFAKGLALGLNVPLVGVNHIEAHIFSALLEAEKPELPFIALIVSGGHTMLLLVKDVGDYVLLGETLDDAAGEAFDKVGKMLGLGYPAGPVVDKLAKSGDAAFVEFPRAMIHENNFDFSFSGLKTSVLYWFKKQSDVSGQMLNDVCASFQRAIIDTLAIKTFKAAKQYGVKSIVAVGGVSANSELRERFAKDAAKLGMKFFTPRPLFSTDNAAMIAMLAALKLERGLVDDLTLRTAPRAQLAQKPIPQTARS
jgi:N6-L-threonylcarbamoyladenine synthase